MDPVLVTILLATTLAGVVSITAASAGCSQLSWPGTGTDRNAPERCSSSRDFSSSPRSSASSSAPCTPETS
jgi:hypothetical protein